MVEQHSLFFLKKGRFFFCILVLLFVLFLLPTYIYAKTQSKSSIAHYIMGLLHERWNEQEQALEEYNKAEEFDYYSAQIHLKLGAEYLQRQDFNNALSHLGLAVKLDPQDIQSHFILGVLYSALGRQEEATVQYEHVLKETSKKEPQNLGIYHNLAEFYFRQNKFDDAITQYEYILSVDPNDKIAYYFMGNILYLQGKKDLSIEKFKKAIEIDHVYADALNSLGYTYAEDGINLDEAESLIMRALSLAPDNGAYIDSLGWVYFKKGLNDKALEQLENAIELMPDPEIYSHLGEVYYKLNMFDKAKDNWEKSLEMDPLQKDVQERLENLKKQEANEPEQRKN